MQNTDEFKLEIREMFWIARDLTTGALCQGPWGVSLPLDNSELRLTAFPEALLSITSSWAQHKNNSEGGTR